MPNHIQNRLHIVGSKEQIKAVFSHALSVDEKGEPYRMDFRKIIPMPSGMENETHSGVETWIKICTGQLNFKSLLSNAKSGKSFGDAWISNGFDDMINYMQSSTAFEMLLGDRPGNLKTFSDEDFNSFIQGVRNYREHGYIGWHSWSNANWGTKWNAYETDDKRNTEDTLFFQTANGKPIPVILELSKHHPDTSMILTYADEDSGSNTGRIVFKDGQVIEEYKPESQSKEGYDLYFELHPDSRNDYKLVGDNYEFVEPEN